MALNDVPQPSQTLLSTQNPIRQNFSVIDAAFLVDHIDYNLAGAGQHKKITFPLNPGAVFAVNQIGLFNQNAAPTNRPDIWMARGIAAAFPMTGYDFIAPLGSDARGWTYLPSGLKMIWGVATIVGAGSTTTVTFNNPAQGGIATFPGFASVIGSIQMTRIAGAAGNIDGFPVLVNANFYSSLASFQFRSSSTSTANRSYTWCAIGL